jgi:hypothetical protein
MAKKLKVKKIVKGLEEVEIKTQKREEKMSKGRDAAVKLQKKKLSSGLELAPMSREDLDKPAKNAHEKGMKTRELKEKIKKKYKIERGPSSTSQASDGAQNAYQKSANLIDKIKSFRNSSDEDTKNARAASTHIKKAGKELGKKYSHGVEESFRASRKPKKLKIKKAK